MNRSATCTAALDLSIVSLTQLSKRLQSNGEVGISCKPARARGPMFSGFNKLILRIVHPIKRLIVLVFNINNFFFQVNFVVIGQVELGFGLTPTQLAARGTKERARLGWPALQNQWPL